MGPTLTSDNVLKIGWTEGPDTLNPFASQWAPSFVIFDLVYSSLYKLQPDGTLTLDAAESVEVSDDGRLWTFNIRKGLRFHDGIPLTSRDVVFSLHLYEFPGEVIPLGELKFAISLREPIPNVEGHLLFHYILPQHVWLRYESALTSFENDNLIGSGPFKLVEYQPNNFAHLAAVENHTQYQPNIDEVVYQVYEDENALVEAIRANEADMIYTLPYSAIETLSNEPDIQVDVGLPLYPTFEEIIINQIAPENCPSVEDGGICTGHPALRDKNVRLAMAQAVDKRKIIDEVLLGAGDPGISMIPTGLGAFFNPNIKDYPYDPAQADKILDDAGYLDTDGDGIREMPAGTDTNENLPLRFRFSYLGQSVFYSRITEQLSEMWAEIGIALEVEEKDADTLIEICCPAFDYDLIIWTWDISPEPGSIFSIFETKEIPTGYNETGYTNPDYDIRTAIQHTETDPEKRKALIWELQRIAHQDVVHIVLFYAQTVQAHRTDRFTGWITDATHLALEDFSNLIAIEPVK